MNVNHFELRKTALLFFDILNGYVAESEAGKPRALKPWIQNAVKLSKAGRAAGLPIFFAKGNHRPTMPRPPSFSRTRTILCSRGQTAK